MSLDPIADAAARVLKEFVTESMSALRDEGPWWTASANGRKLTGGVAYHDWTWSDLELARQTSRRLLTHNEFGIGGIKTRRGYIVDTGFTYSVVPKDAAAGRMLVAGGHNLDAANDYLQQFLEANDFNEVEAETMTRLDRDGEAWLRLFPAGDDIPDVRFVEPERVRPNGEIDTQDGFSRWGIETDPHDAKRIVGYWIEPAIGEPPELVPEAEVVHIAANADGSIPRGIPLYQPVFENLRRCEDLLTSMSSIAKARAKIALIRYVKNLNEVKSENIKSRLTTGVQANPDGTTRHVSIDDYPFGAVIRANADDRFDFPNNNVGSSDLVNVLQADLRAVAVLVTMPEWMFTGLADQKYSNALVVESPTLKSFRRIQTLLTSRLGSGSVRERTSVCMRALRMSGLFSPELLKLVRVECKAPSLEVRDRAGEAGVWNTLRGMGAVDLRTIQEGMNLDPEETKRRLDLEKQEQQPPSGDGGENPLAGLTKVGEAWYSDAALEWVAEGRDRSHLVKTKRPDKNGVVRTVYVRPSEAKLADKGHKPKADPVQEHKARIERTTARIKSPQNLTDENLTELGSDLKTMTKTEIQAVRKEAGLSKSGRKQELADGLLKYAKERRTPPAVQWWKDTGEAFRKANIDKPWAVEGQTKVRNSLRKAGLVSGKQASIADLAKVNRMDEGQAAAAAADLVDRGELAWADDTKTHVGPAAGWRDKDPSFQERAAAFTKRVDAAIPSWLKKTADVVDSWINPFYKPTAEAAAIADSPLSFDDIVELVQRAMLDAAEDGPEAVAALLEVLQPDDDAAVELSDSMPRSNPADSDEIHVGEAWYTREALEWVLEGRDRSHLVKVKRADKNGVRRTLYIRQPGPAKDKAKAAAGSQESDPKSGTETPKSSDLRKPLAEEFSSHQEKPDHPVAKAIAADKETIEIVDKLRSVRDFSLDAADEDLITRSTEAVNKWWGLKKSGKLDEAEKFWEETRDIRMKGTYANIDFSSRLRRTRDSAIDLIRTTSPLKIETAEAPPQKGLRPLSKPFTRYSKKKIKEQRAGAAAGKLFVESITSDKINLPTLGVGHAGDGRGYYHPAYKSIALGDENHERVAVHEIGHAIGFANPAIQKKCKEFQEYRCGDEERVDLGKYGPGMKGEMGRKDRFDKAMSESDAYYTGKSYPGGETEILTMGLEQLHKDPVGFARKDPEYCTFVLSMLKGGF